MIKNYTSSVPVSRTIARIEESLAKAGASGINKDYCGGVLRSICFRVAMPNGKEITIKLPANTEAVYQTMIGRIKKPRRGTVEKIKDQAERTAWKLIQDWVEVQLSLIQLQKVDFLQVFLPYVWTGEKTFYGLLKENEFRALPESTAT